MNQLVGLSRKSQLMSWIKPPSPSLNYNKRYVRKLVLEAEKNEQSILDIGSGGRRLSQNSITLDIEHFDNVDVIGNADHIPLKNESVDFIILSAVLEHVKHPNLVVSEIKKVLKRGGILYVENPFLQPYHADPHDFQRYTISGLTYLLRDFETLDSGVCVGPFSAMTFFVRKLSTVFFTSAYTAKFIELLVGWLTFWIKYFDWLLIRAKKLHVVASGIFLLLKKP